MCRVQRIYYKPEGSSKGLHVNSVFVKNGWGIEGDKHAGKPLRHLSLLKTTTRDKIESLSEHGICTLRFKENISFSGNIHIEEGQVLDIGKVRVRVTITGKECFQECNLRSNKKLCPMNEVIFAEVLESGIINTEDEIKLI
jgi:MOSC domain-containing protein YiiM